MPLEEPENSLAEEQQSEARVSGQLKKEQVLSFRCVDRVLEEGALRSEFELMRDMVSSKKKPTPDDFRRVGMGSGSHLLKLTTPRADSKNSVLRFRRPSSNVLPFFAPSLNAPDIPYAKIVYRPLEIKGRAPKSVVDHLRDPDDTSEVVLEAFKSVFGDDCLDSLKSTLLGDGQTITSLPDTGEFPTIFLPRPGGGDIQATPVSPVEAFMGFKAMSAAWFLKQADDAPPVPRGRWIRQSISAKPQNISGMIGGPRQRFLAEMPSVMRDYDAAILRYSAGGSFPAWVDASVEPAVMHYAGRLNIEYTNRNIRAGLDWYADELISGALSFISEVEEDVREHVVQQAVAERALRPPPRPSTLIMRRRWKKADREKAMIALTSEHFRDRERIALEKAAV